MKNHFIIFISILLFSSVTVEAQTQTNGGNGKPNGDHRGVAVSDEVAIVINGEYIALSEAIKRAIEVNPDIYVNRYNAAMADTDQMKFYGKYSPVLRAEGKTSFDTNPELYYEKRGKEMDSYSGSLAVIKNFSFGTTVSAGVSHTYQILNTGLGPKYDMNIPMVFATIEQELVKNSFGYNDRRQRKILNNVTLAKRDAYTYSISLIALGVIYDYWTVVLAQNHVDNAKLLLSETEKVRKITIGKLKIGLSEEFEINYWNSLLAFSKTKLSQAEQNYRNALRKFYRDINLDKEITMQFKAVLSDKVPEINAEEALKKAFEKRVDYLNAVRELENAKLALNIYENNMLPSVKIGLSGAVMNYDIDSKTDDFPYSEKTSTHNIEAKLAVSYPFVDVKQRVERRNARWNIHQSEKKLESVTKSVKDDVITKIENIQTCHNLYVNAKEARRQAAMYYKSMIINLKGGRFAASSVRDALVGLIDCREMELQLLVAYNTALIQYEISKNELFESYNIDINKYIDMKK